MPGFLSTAYKFLRLRGSASLFDRLYLAQFEFGERNQALSNARLRVERDVCYHPRPDGQGVEQSLDIYAPAATAAVESEAAAPVVVFMHGGGWRAADKRDRLGIHANICRALAERGLLAVGVNYRLSPRVHHPAHALDAAHAVVWIRENIGGFGGDADNIFISGHSAGAHLAARVAHDERYLHEAGTTAHFIRGVIGISGIYNIRHFAGRNLPARFLMTRPAFGPDKKAWDQASPVNHVRAGAPPFLMINAEDDEQLEAEAEELAARLRKVGAHADTHIIAGTNHFTILSFVGSLDDTLIELIASFVKRNIFQKVGGEALEAGTGA